MLQFPLGLLYDCLEASSSSSFGLEWENFPVVYSVKFLHLLDPSMERRA